MHKKKSFFQMLRDNAYYIALGICAVAVIVSGVLFLRDPEQSREPAASEVPAAILSDLPRVREPLTDETEPRLFAPETVPSGSDPTEETGPEGREAPAPKPQAPELTASAPVPGEVLQCFCMDRLCYNPTTRDWRTHAGIDIAADLGDPVRAAAAGTVISVYEDDLLGQTVAVRHTGGWVSHYANLASEVPVSVGQTVSAGQELGTVGQTALLEIGSEPHLHFAVYRDNVATDPAEFLTAAKAPEAADTGLQ